ncbi:MAG: peptidoglycan binding protein CsiV [Pseudomonadales bacterium]|nr:peptidoglycan binding protein CsiV [Pseudomonadales bacterium]
MILKNTYLKHLSSSLIALISCTTLLLMPLVANAQTKNGGSASPKEQWYQVNLLVFQHLKAKTRGNGVEQWPRETELSYPKHTVYLKDASNPTANPFSDHQMDYRTFVNRESGLEQENRNIRLSAGFRTLFYRQWYQALGSGVTGKAIAISGGKTFDGQPQLEGWIRFSQKRYLHLEVNLWLHDYEMANQEFGLQAKVLPQPTPEPEHLTAQLFDFGFPTTPSEFPEEIDEELAAIPFYIRQPRRVVTFVMQQKRRMKSKELHHLDHPLLGVLVEVIPYEPEEIETIDKDTAIWLKPKNITQNSQ